MSVSKRFEILVKGTYKRFIDQGFVPPVATEDGILVGNALIQQDGIYKNIFVDDEKVFADISLNCVAIKIANSLALGKSKTKLVHLYNMDKSYNRLYIDSTIFLDRYHKASNSNDWDRAEIMWIRYDDAKQRAESLKEQIETLSAI
jgi:hypothetical protein